MQLYNLKADIGETKNLIAKYPEKVAELKAALKKIICQTFSFTNQRKLYPQKNPYSFE